MNHARPWCPLRLVVVGEPLEEHPLVEMLGSIGDSCGPTEDLKSEGRSLRQTIVVNLLVAKSAGISGVPRQVSACRYHAEVPLAVHRRRSLPGSAESDMIAVVGLTSWPLSGGTECANGRGDMARTVTLRLEEDVYDELRAAAAAERSPLSNFIATAALARVREARFVDDRKMAEILSDDALVRRLKAGSQQARRRRGDFVA